MEYKYKIISFLIAALWLFLNGLRKYQITKDGSDKRK